jgi:hypothetical protein
MSSKTLASKLAEQHGQIVDAIRQGRRTENRRAARFEHRVRAEIHPCVEGTMAPAMPVQMEDFSHRGISFYMKIAINRGEQFVFQLPRMDAGTTAVLCTVAYCRKASETDFRVGAEFTCILPTEGPLTPPSDTAAVARIKQSILS